MSPGRISVNTICCLNVRGMSKDREKEDKKEKQRQGEKGNEESRYTDLFKE